MGSTGDFHLTFDPLATDEQLAQVREALDELDPGYFTVTNVVAAGTKEGQHGGVNSDGEVYAFWHKPLWEITNEVLAGIMEAAGLNGHGFLNERYDGDGWTPPDDQYRFVFGQCDEMRSRIKHDEEVGRLWSIACSAHTAMESAAKSGDDARLVMYAHQWREARTAHELFTKGDQ